MPNTSRCMFRSCVYHGNRVLVTYLFEKVLDVVIVFIEDRSVI